MKKKRRCWNSERTTSTRTDAYYLTIEEGVHADILAGGVLASGYDAQEQNGAGAYELLIGSVACSGHSMCMYVWMDLMIPNSTLSIYFWGSYSSRIYEGRRNDIQSCYMVKFSKVFDCDTFVCSLLLAHVLGLLGAAAGGFGKRGHWDW